ncbi:MAG: FG-GAP-like repeat-containing protein, partial [Gemmataceae bacterium]
RLAPGWLPARINLGMALYNSASRTDDPVLAEAIAVFEQVLADDPTNLYAHFNLGIIHKYQANYPAAISHFRAVTEADPADDRAWLYLAQSNVNAQTDPEALKLFQKALELNPYLVPAWHGVANHVATSADEQKRLIALQDDLRRANWEDEARDTKHSEQGRYATAIGRPELVKPAAVGPPPMFQQKPAWTTELAGMTGGVLVRLDFNRDGKPDLLLLSDARGVLLRNDGTKFTDVSVAMGLTGGSRRCAVGDYDNDGWPDLVLAGPTGLKLCGTPAGRSSRT